MTGTKIDILIVKLEDINGNRPSLGGHHEDEEVVKQHLSTDNDIADLKEYIIEHFIESKRRCAHVLVFTHSNVTPGGYNYLDIMPAKDTFWEACNVTDALVHGQCYGYIDLVEKESKEKVTGNADESFKSDTSVAELSEKAGETSERIRRKKPNATAATPPAKKVKKQHFLEFSWTNDDETEDYMCDNDIDKNDDEGFHNSRAIRKNGELENDNDSVFRKNGELVNAHHFDISLVNGKSKNRKVLAMITVEYWVHGLDLQYISNFATDLEPFCKDLWKAAGRNTELTDCVIDFSDLSIQELVEEAIPGVIKPNVLYIRDTFMTRDGSSKDSFELLHRLLSPMEVLAIAHKSDLEKFQVLETAKANNSPSLKFSSIGEEWFVIVG